jgi:hypothetical protein
VGQGRCGQPVKRRLSAPLRFFRVFFSLSSLELGLLIFAWIGGASALGVATGRYLRGHSDVYREPIGALQGALLGLIGLVLAFALTLAVGRYQDRRTDVVDDANTIGTVYLRAQTIAEPQRSRSLALLRSYNDLAIRVTYERPGGGALRATTRRQDTVQQQLWRLAGEAINARRLSGLNNRVPTAVLWLELIGAAAALALLALYVSLHGRGLVSIVTAVALVSLLILVTFDLDRPTRGVITVPATPLLAEKATMSPPPAAPAPH